VVVFLNFFGDRKTPMSDAEKDRRIGRDEMNLAEFPIALVAERVPPGLKTIAFEDRHGKLTVTGSDVYGLPTAPDSDVIVGLIQLTKLRNDFTCPTASFSRYELLKLLGWEDKGRNYQRLDESLRRWVGVTLYYEGAWWDNSIKCRVDESFHILERVLLFDQEIRRTLRAQRQALPLSSFTWNAVFFASCQANNLKQLDLGVYFGLKSAVSKQLYRFLDKRFYIRGDWTFDLRELAFEHIGMSRNYTAALLKAKLQPALEELEAIGFLAPMSPAERYSKTGRGAWTIRLVRKLPPPAEAKPAETQPAAPEPTGPERELVERGVTQAVAAELVRDFPAERLRRQVEVVDWLRETKPQRIKDLGAYLAEAIRKDFAPPAGFRGRAERAEAEAARRAALDQEVATRRTKARERAERDRIQAYRAALAPDERERLDAEALAGADPADRAAYEAAAPPVKKMLRVGLRDALIRRRLGLPAAD
jgi:Replication initiator protein A